MKKKIVVIGTGYVGLPAALLLARAGQTVIGVDIDENIVRSINDGVLHIREADLQKIMNEPEVRQNIIAQTVPCEADVFLIAVPTPIDPRKKVAEMKYVCEAVESIVPYLRAENLIILESTVPPLTCRNIITPIVEKGGLRVGKDLFLAHCPERILPGDVFHEIIHNDRVIGAADQASRHMAQDIYKLFVNGNLYQTDDITAEICKLMENTYRDVNIALANEFAAVMEGLGIDPMKAIRLANKHPRVNILKPGIGVGGHCIALDPWFIKEVDPENSRLIFTSRLINDEMPDRIAARIRYAVRNIHDPNIVAIGASYKANIDDMRESPALRIVNLLKEDGYVVENYDPLIKGMEYASLKEVCRGKDCLVILVEHDVVISELKSNFQDIADSMNNNIILRFYPEE